MSFLNLFKSLKMSHKSYFEEHLLKYKEDTGTNGMFVCKHVEKTNNPDKSTDSVVNVVNYVTALKWLADRNFLMEFGNDMDTFNDRLYIVSPLQGVVAFKTPWSDIPLEFNVRIKQKIEFEDNNRKDNPVITWKAFTYLTWLFDNAESRDDLKDSPLCNKEIYRMLSGTNEKGETISISKIESTWHDTPQNALMFIFNKIDELLPKLESLATYQHQLEEAQNRKDTALNSIGIEELQMEYTSSRERGWMEK